MGLNKLGLYKGLAFFYSANTIMKRTLDTKPIGTK